MRPAAADWNSRKKAVSGASPSTTDACARATERYFTVAKLPHNPCWRDVLRSAYFVLGQCTMEAQKREDLQRRVDAVLACTRRSALV